MAPNGLEIRLLSSLTKVFADDALRDKSFKRASCLRGEVFSFQLAYRSQSLRKGLQVEVESSLKKHITIREVLLAPCSALTMHAVDAFASLLLRRRSKEQRRL